MRIFATLLKGNGRWPQNINKVPFKALLPLKLRNHVSGKSDRQPEVPCLHELTLLFASLKTHEFDDLLCVREADKLRQANVEYLTKRFHQKRLVNQGIVAPGKNLSFRQINIFLKGYPNPK